VLPPHVAGGRFLQKNVRAGQTGADVPWYVFLSSKTSGTSSEIRDAV